MVKATDFTKDHNDQLPFDVVEDAIVFMRNDPMFYRKEYYPVFAKIADLAREGKKINRSKMLASMIENGLSEYCKRYNIAQQPDEVFDIADRTDLMNRLYSEEMEQIRKGEYK